MISGQFIDALSTNEEFYVGMINLDQSWGCWCQYPWCIIKIRTVGLVPDKTGWSSGFRLTTL